VLKTVYLKCIVGVPMLVNSSWDFINKHVIDSGVAVATGMC
jgi:hypothetical protein